LDSGECILAAGVVSILRWRRIAVYGALNCLLNALVWMARESLKGNTTDKYRSLSDCTLYSARLLALIDYRCSLEAVDAVEAVVADRNVNKGTNTRHFIFGNGVLRVKREHR